MKNLPYKFLLISLFSILDLSCSFSVYSWDGNLMKSLSAVGPLICLVKESIHFLGMWAAAPL